MINNVILGDCLIEMLNIEDCSIDCIITDLPYGTSSCKWDIVIPFDRLWEQYNRIIKKGGAIVLFGNEPFSSFLRLSNIKMFKYDWIWEKSKSGSAFTAKYRPVNKHETISVFGNGVIKYNPQLTKGKAYHRVHDTTECDINNHNIGFNKKKVETHNYGFRYPITVQKFQQKWRRQDQLHPTQKPVELLEYLIKTYTNEGDLVLDSCAGSGTTLFAAKNLNRNFIGIEKDEVYYNKILERLK